jgi:hypothetical protein
MSDRPKPIRKANQQQRLSAALRENLKRRKAQAKGRSVGVAAEELSDRAHDSAGIPDDKGTTEPR